MTTNSYNHEREYTGLIMNGFGMIFFTFILIPVLTFLCIYFGVEMENYVLAGLGGFVCFVLFIFGCVGYFTQEPNVARVMIFFGKYVGTCKRVGFFWANPFCSRVKLSMRLRNMDIQPIKVNDKVGNPVLIGMVLVWRIKDTYRVTFDLDSQSLGANSGSVNEAALSRFVNIQSDAALREVTGQFAYDESETDTEELTLRSGGKEINDLLESKINERLSMVGIEVVEARINYLAYAPEIAAVMLRRQQASAIIAAREKIVEGAVTMVQMALNRIEDEKIVEFSPEKKASMVSNLMLVLCGDEQATPVINASAD